jgi:hypothetical protein
MVRLRLMANFMLKYSQLVFGGGCEIEMRWDISLHLSVCFMKRHTHPLPDVISFVHVFLFFLMSMSTSAKTGGLDPNTSSTQCKSELNPDGVKQVQPSVGVARFTSTYGRASSTMM